MKEKSPTTDTVIELICNLYSLMDEDDKREWSLEKAEEMVADQVQYEKARGLQLLGDYDVKDFYDTILEFIRQDEQSEATQ